MKRFTLLASLALAALLTSPAMATISGTLNIPGDYPTLAAAITDLNLQGVGGTGVTLNLLAGNPETAPAGGYVIGGAGSLVLTTSGPGTPVVIQGNGNTITASGALTVGALNDAIFKLVGADYITITGFTMQENPANTVTAAATNTMTEWGVALLYVTTTDGAQNNTIQGNTITLNRTYQNTWGIYSNSTHTATAVTVSATATTTAGGNSGLKIYGNTISNVNQGICVVGPTAAADNNTGVDIGGAGGAQANSITNWGTTGTFSGYVNVSGTLNGILVRNSVGFNVSFNTVTSSVGGNTVTASERGIYVPSFSNAPTGTFTNTINNNIISIQSGIASGTLNGIIHEATTGTATSSLVMNNNDFNTFGHTAASPTGAVTFISNAMACLNSTINNNTFTNITLGTTGSVTFISNSVTTPTAGGTKTINGNSIVTGFNKTGAGGTVTLYTDNASSVAGVIVNNNNNDFSKITVTGTTTIAGWSNTDGGSPTKTFQNNTFTNWTGGTNAVTVLNVNFGSASTATVTLNTISNITGGGAVSGIVLGSSIFNGVCTQNTVSGLSTTGSSSAVIGISVAGTTQTVNNNTVNGLAGTGAIGPVATGIAVTGGTTVNLFKNKVYDIVESGAATTSPAVNGILMSGGTTVNCYNNLIGDLRVTTASLTDAIRGISITSATATSNYNVSFNTVYLNASSSGANFGTTGILHTTSTTATTATLNMRDNIVVNNSTPNGTGFTVAYRRTSTTLTNFGSVSNNNLLYAGVPSASRLIFYDGTNSDQTLAAYKTRVTPRDASSITENPPFLSTTGSSPSFLHINPAIGTQLESGGITIAGITDDYDGDVRNVTTPDIGADEGTFTLIDLVAPVISYAPLGNSSSVTTVGFTNVTVTDPSGVNGFAGTRPRVYYKKLTDANTVVDNTSATNGWKFAEANGSTSQFDFTIDYSLIFGGSVAIGDVIQYFVVAEDNAAPPNVGINSGTFTATPASVALAAGNFPIGGTINSYSIVGAPLNGDYTVGTLLFNSATGRNITFERKVQMVTREVLEPADAVPQMGKDKSNTDVFLADHQAWRTVLREVEEVTWVPMENGQKYDGPLYSKRSENPGLPPRTLSGVYATITAAVADLDARGVSGPVRFLLTDPSYPSETFPITVNVQNVNLPTAANPVAIKPNTGVTASVTGASATNPLFKIFNTNYITIDGSNTVGGTTRDLTLENTSATSPNVVWFGSSGTTPITGGSLKNCVVRNGANTSSAVVISDGTTAGNAGYFSSMEVRNNQIEKAFIGVYANGGTTPQNGASLTYADNQLNTSGANAIRLVGLYMQGVNGATVSNNTIGNFDATSDENDIGIWLASGTINATVSGNSVSNLGYTGTGSFAPIGINVTPAVAAANDNVTRNSVSSISTSGSTQVRGIASAVAGSANIVIQRNNISGITNNNTGTYGAYGIDASAGDNFTIKNNFVSDLRFNMTGGAAFSTTFGVFGIRIGSGAGHIVDDNSVNMFGSMTGTATTSLLSAGLCIVGTGTNVDIRNNILSNTLSGGTTSIAHVSLYLPSGATSVMNLTDNNNAYYSGADAARQGIAQAGTTAGTGFYLASNFNPGATSPATNLRAYSSTLSAAGTNDNASLANTAAAPYTSNTDLHVPTTFVSPVSNVGASIAGITDDIDGDLRSATPDIGADEFSYPAPGAFSLLTPANGSPSEPISGNLTWSSSTNSTGYDVYLDGNPSPTTLVSSNQAGTTYAYSGLSNSTLYYWKVVARGVDQNLASSVFSFTTAAAPPPNAPTNVTVTNIADTQMDVNWVDNSANEDGFRVYQALAAGGPYTNVSGDLAAGTTTYTALGLTPNTHYYFRVVSFTTISGESTPASGDALSLAQVPGAPVLSNATLNSIKVTVTPLSNPAPTEFDVRVFDGVTTSYMTTGGTLSAVPVWGTYAAFGGASGTVLTGLAGTTTYTVDVQARNSDLIETAFGTSASLATASPLCGTYQVGASQAAPFNTLTNAVAHLNAVGVSCAVVFELTDAAYGPSETFPITIDAVAGGSATNTVTIKPSPVLGPGLLSSPTITGSNATAILILNGADYVTIDGSSTGGTSRDLTIVNTNTSTTSAVVWGQTTAGLDAATHDTFKNLNLVGSGNTQTLIAAGFGGTSIGAAGTGNNNNTIRNNNISKTGYGIYSAGASALNKNTGTVIAKNTINSGAPDNVQIAGIFVAYEDSIRITDNVISELNRSTTSVGITLGMGTGANLLTVTGAEVTNATVTGNNIGAVVSTSTVGYTAAGIAVAVASSGTNLIANNMISGVTSLATPDDGTLGIFVAGGAGSTTEVYFNSVSMVGARGAASNPSYALAIAGTDPAIDVRNNILSNSQTSTSATGKSYAIGLAYSSYDNLTSDYNDLITSGTSGAFAKIGGLGNASGSDRASLAAWRTETAQDGNSISANPLFISLTHPSLPDGTPVVDVSTANLHIDQSGATSPVANAGTPLAIGVDIDGDTRAAAPDIGADEFTTFTLTVNATNGSVSRSPDNSSYNPGASVQLTATADPCYHFTGWSGDASGIANPLTVVMDSTKNITANFARDAFSIVASAGPGGSIIPNDTTSVLCGDSQKYDVRPDSCYRIAQVLVDGVPVTTPASGPFSYTFSNVQANHTISATFTGASYTIVASAGLGGSISPNDTTTVSCGGTQKYDVTPDSCYHIAQVLVDGVPVTTPASGPFSYVFSNVQADHTISATFAPSGPYAITTSAGAGGSISPSSASVACGGSQKFDIVANKCFSVSDVLVDGVSVGAVNTYTFTNVHADHTIAATFTGSNLLGNAGFESPVIPAGPPEYYGAGNAWTSFGGGIFTVGSVVVPPHTGNQSLKVFGGCCSGAFQQFPATPGQTWNGGVWILNSSVDPMSGGQVAAVNIEWKQADGTTNSTIIPFISNGTFTAASTRDVWTLQTITGVAPADAAFARLVVITGDFQPGGPGGAPFYDDAFLETLPYTITASAGPGGSISPSGAVPLACGADRTFTITPDSCYAIADVKVDNVSVGAVNTYTFTDVQANHTIEATFGAASIATVQVLTPNGGEDFAVGEVAKLSWTTSACCPIAVVDLYISRDYGATYTPVALGTANDGTYDWTVNTPGTNTGFTHVFSALLKVVAHDCNDSLVTDVSDSAFSIFDVATPTLLTNLAVAPTAEGLEVRWQVADPSVFASLTLERSESTAGPWAKVDAAVTRDGQATVVLDRSVRDGQSYWYRLLGKSASGATATFGPVKGDAANLVRAFALSNVSPNPTAGPLTIEFAVPREARVALKVLDIQGREVATVAEGTYKAGRYSVTWNGQGNRGLVPAGAYFVRFDGGGKQFVKRVMMVR